MDESEIGERRIAPPSQEETPTKEAEERVTSMKARIVFKQVRFAMKIAAIWNNKEAIDQLDGQLSEIEGDLSRADAEEYVNMRAELANRRIVLGFVRSGGDDSADAVTIEASPERRLGMRSPTQPIAPTVSETVSPIGGVPRFLDEIPSLELRNSRNGRVDTGGYLRGNEEKEEAFPDDDDWTVAGKDSQWTHRCGSGDQDVADIDFPRHRRLCRNSGTRISLGQETVLFLTFLSTMQQNIEGVSFEAQGGLFYFIP